MNQEIKQEPKYRLIYIYPDGSECFAMKAPENDLKESVERKGLFPHEYRIEPAGEAAKNKPGLFFVTKKPKLYFDCEIIRAIPGEVIEEGIEYCDGWSDYKGMDIACMCGVFCDSKGERPLVFLNRDDFRRFFYKNTNSVEYIGFNNHRFDDNLIEECWFCDGDFLNFSYRTDLREELILSAGFDPDSRVRGFSLDNLCKINGIDGKKMDGALAPVEWQRGNWGSVIDYCLDDVKKTKQLHELLLAGKKLICPEVKTAK